MSTLESTILVHVNNLPNTQDGVVIYLTIDMFQFADVTASYVLIEKHRFVLDTLIYSTYSELCAKQFPYSFFQKCYK